MWIFDRAGVSTSDFASSLTLHYVRVNCILKCTKINGAWLEDYNVKYISDSS